jgi:hypothetical protein
MRRKTRSRSKSRRPARPGGKATGSRFFTRDNRIQVNAGAKPPRYCGTWAVVVDIGGGGGAGWTDVDSSVVVVVVDDVG